VTAAHGPRVPLSGIGASRVLVMVA
ncbi:MAG: hypothetical protein QOD68_2692, partial [Actinomycetota bacterium]|nr:hypothetical protein [Actinomycetota bacterium]